MSEGMLSQDEIDALLNGTLDDNEPNTPSTAPFIEDFLSSMECDALGEIGNISIGSSATALSTLLNQKVEITTPSVSVVRREMLEEEFPVPYVAISVNYTIGFQAINLLVIKTEDAAIIANLMMGGDGHIESTELDEIQLSAVQEAMNQMMGSSATSMSQIFSKKVDISPPAIDLLDFKGGKGLESIPEDDVLVKVSFKLKIGTLIDSNIMQLFPVSFAKELVAELLNPSSSNSQIKEVPVAATPSLTNYAEQQPENNYGTQQREYISPTPTPMPANVQPAVFSEFQPVSLPELEMRNLDLLYDVPLKVTVELGRTKRSVRDMLELAAGSIIELDKLAGEPVDILVNDRLIAQGEVVVIDENFGVRVTDIISQSARLKKLK